MMISVLLGKQIVSMLLMVLMGFLVVRFKFLKAEDSKVLSALALYIIGPCMTLDAFQVDFTPDKINGLCLTIVLAILAHAVFFLLTAIVQKPFHLDVVERNSVIYTNSANLIIPIVSYVLGDEWILYTSGFLMVQVTLFWTHCYSSFNPNENAFNIKKILMNVNLMSIFVGFFLFVTGIRFPEPCRLAVHNVGVMIGPARMIVTGMLIGSMDLNRLILYKKIPLLVFLRLIAYPLVIMALFRIPWLTTWVKDGDIIRMVTLFACIAPSASTVTQMTHLYGYNGEYASLINVVTTLLCVFTMPLLVYLFQM